MDTPLVIGDSDSEDYAPKRKVTSVATVNVTALQRPPEKNKPCSRKQLKLHQEAVKPVVAAESVQEVEEESDGTTALQSVQAQEQRKKRGPKNGTLNHWSKPKATVDRGSKPCWLFKSQYCDQ